MKTTSIPAQITTVEDRIAGPLSFTQLVLLMAPLFVCGFSYIALPPVMDLTAYKIVITVFSSLIFGILAFRLKGRIVFDWVRILLVYWLRPSIHVYNKNNLFAREIVTKKVEKKRKQVKDTKTKANTSNYTPSYDHEIYARQTNFEMVFVKKGVVSFQKYFKQR